MISHADPKSVAQVSVNVREEDLEETNGDLALAWVKERNNEVMTEFAKTPLFENKKMECLAAGRFLIPPVFHEGYIYQFLQNDTYKKGLFRRISLAEYKKAQSVWEPLLDMNCLPEQDVWESLINWRLHDRDSKEDWIFHGAIYCPASARVLIQLSFGGGGIFSYIYREFDVEKKEFVKDGFNMYENKFTANQISWCDSNSLWLVVSALEGELSKENNWYYRLAHLHRGESSVKSKKIYDSGINYFSIKTFHANSETYLIAEEYLDMTEHKWVLIDVKNDAHTPIPIPIDAELQCIFESKLIIILRLDWAISSEKTYLSGSIIAIDIHSIKQEKDLKTELIFAPTESRTPRTVVAAEHYLLVEMLNNVNGEVHKFENKNGQWVSSQLPLPSLGKVTIVSDSLISYQNFLTPCSFYHYDVDKDYIEALPSYPQPFDAISMTVTQDRATSQDGTSVPYYIVHPKNMKFDGSNATLLQAYGGFELSMLPTYHPPMGKLWLSDGGVHVVANIRGGAELGPKWHQAALKENRHKAFEDFYAVASDLITKKVTSREHLGIWGTSNGGLLMGVAFTQRPELFNAVVCEAPLTDMFASDKRTASSWQCEYGDREEEKIKDCLSQYSPYQNLSKDKIYPRVLFFSATNDNNVPPYHARKMAHKMREMGKDLYYYENSSGGHNLEGDLTQYALRLTILFFYLKKQLMDDKQMLSVNQFKFVMNELDTLSEKTPSAVAASYHSLRA